MFLARKKLKNQIRKACISSILSLIISAQMPQVACCNRYSAGSKMVGSVVCLRRARQVLDWLLPRKVMMQLSF